LFPARNRVRFRSPARVNPTLCGMRSTWKIEPDVGPEPLGNHAPIGARLDEVSKGFAQLAAAIRPSENVRWSFCRPQPTLELGRAVRISLLVGVPLFLAACAFAIGSSTFAYALAGVALLVAGVGGMLVWRRLSGPANPAVPGFVAALTNERLVVVLLEKPDQVWTMNVGSILHIAGDARLHEVGGILVSGRWINPKGMIVQMKLPLLIGPDSAATAAMLRRRLTADCIEAA